MVRIGIYSGAFDPVHAGHVSFALQAQEDAGLNGGVYFLPDRQLRQRPGIEHYAHRVAMLRSALAPHPSLGLLELVDKRLTVSQTLPKLEGRFSGAELVFLMGADTFVSLPEWARADVLIKRHSFVVSVRGEAELQAVNATTALLHLAPARVHVLDSVRPGASSALIRYALRQNQVAEGLLPSVAGYVKREWLYAQLPQVKNP